MLHARSRECFGSSRRFEPIAILLNIRDIDPRLALSRPSHPPQHAKAARIVDSDAGVMGPDLRANLGTHQPIHEVFRSCYSTIASASISTSISGETSAEIPNMLVAGRISPKNSP